MCLLEPGPQEPKSALASAQHLVRACNTHGCHWLCDWLRRPCGRAVGIGEHACRHKAVTPSEKVRTGTTGATGNTHDVAVGVRAKREAGVASGLCQARRPATLAAGNTEAGTVGRRAIALAGRGHVCAEGVALCVSARWLAQAAALARTRAAAGDACWGAGTARAECEAGIANWLIQARRAAHLAAGNAHVVAVGGRAAALVRRGHIGAEGVSVFVHTRWLAQATALGRRRRATCMQGCFLAPLEAVRLCHHAVQVDECPCHHATVSRTARTSQTQQTQATNSGKQAAAMGHGRGQC